MTNGLYLEFLNDLIARGREEEALRWAPRERSGHSGEPGPLSFGRDRDGRFVLTDRKHGDMWHADLPVTMVDWECARAYAAWRAERRGQAWRLPGEWEWEKAARGVDGRYHPWGDGFDPSWCCMRESHAGGAALALVDSFPVDESPYGVRGMAGNDRDWCADAYVPGRPVRDGERAPDPVRAAEEAARSGAPRIFRGGSWFADARRTRVAWRDWGDARNRWFGLGFRLARSFPGGGDGS